MDRQKPSIHTLFEQQAARTPNAVAVILNGQSWTYQELNRRCNQLARSLQSLGVGPGMLVGICLDRSPELLVSLFAVLKTGGACLPLDPASPVAYLTSILEESRPAALLTRKRSAGALPAGRFRLFDLEAEWPVIGDESHEDLDQQGAPEDLAYVFYSSGRGVTLDHGAILNRIDWLQEKLSLGPSDAALHRSSLALDTSIWEIFWPLLSGSRVVLGEPQAEWEIDHTWQTIAEKEISVANFLPSELAALVESGAGELLKSAVKLRAVICSGEPLRGHVAEEFLRRFSGDLYYLYGHPEAAAVSLADCRNVELREGVVFYEAAGFPVYLLDQHLQPVPIGVPGDIYIAGGGIARGYLNRAAETERSFLSDPFGELSDERMFRTGDVGVRLEDGCIKLAPRNDRQRWLRGRRFDLGQIEAALLMESSVEEAAVVMRATDAGEPEVVAYVVSAYPFSPDRLRAHLETLLPPFMIPTAYVSVSNLPLTSAGLVDEKALSRFAVIDPDLVNRWERRFRFASGSERIALASHDRRERQPVLHLSDLLPDWKSDSSTESREAGISPRPQADLKDGAERKRPAISRGEPLRTHEDGPATLLDALRAAARADDKGISYVQPDCSETFQSYRALLQEAERISTGLRRLGVRPEEKVIFQLDRNEDFIAAFWGCIHAGAVPAPINVAPSYERANSTTQKLRHAWEMLDRPLVLSSARLVQELGAWSNSSRLDGFRVGTIEELRECEASRAPHKSRPDDPAIILLTSGSTGRPKGVVQSHRAILSRSASTAQLNHFSADDISLNWFPLDHVGGIIMFHLRDVFLGCRQIEAPTQLILQQPLRWLDLIDRYGATITWAPNFAFGLINERAEEIRQGRWDLSSLRFILNGGEAIVARTARRFMSLLAGFGLPGAAMHPAWGMSETSSGVTYSDRFSLDSTSDDDPFVEVGLPIPGFSMRIVDADDRLVEEGEVGRLQVKGPTVTSGYYRNPELNREVFTADGWFNTGDLGLLRDGRLTICGREKDVIIINGVNFYSHEIEAVVEEVAGIEASFTAACATREPGSDTDQMIVFFSPAVSSDDELSNMIDAVREKVVRDVGVTPAYLVPVERSVIPKTEVGKIQRAQLRERFEAGEFDYLLKKVDILSGNARTIPNWFHQRVWRPREIRIAKAGPAPRGYLVFLDRHGLGERLCSEFDRSGLTCVGVEPAVEFERSSPTRYRIKPDDPEHYRRLMQFLSEDNLQIDRIIHLWTYSDQSVKVESREQLEQAQIFGSYSLVFLAQALAGPHHGERPVQLQVVSRNAQAVAPADEPVYAYAPVLGLIKTLAIEMPWLRCRHVDLAPGVPEALAVHIIRESQDAGKEREIAYRDGRRLAPRLRSVEWTPAHTHPLPFKKGGWYLLSGGLGGIGAQVARYLLKNYQARLLLVGRTVLPARDEWPAYLRSGGKVADKIRALQLLEETGGEVVYEAADVTDLERLRSLTDRIAAEWRGSLDGIIQFAGIFRERPIISETGESLAAAFEAKLIGSWTLGQLVAGLPEALFITFSSVNGFFGGAGAGAYAAASSFLDSFSADQSHRGRLHSYCLAWSMWDRVGMSCDYEKQDATRARGYQIIPPDKGLLSFLAALRQDRRRLLIGLDGGNPHIRPHVEAPAYQVQSLSAFFPTDIDRRAIEKLRQLVVEDRFHAAIDCDLVEIEEMPMTSIGEIDREQLATLARLSPGDSTGRVAPRTDFERQVAGIWQSVLGGSTPGIHDNFFEIGGHSILATQVISRINEAFKIEAPLRQIFESPTIATLTRHLQQPASGSGLPRPPLMRRVGAEAAPLSFAQQRLWFIDQLEPDNTVYNVPGAVELKGRLNLEALESAINEIVRRHEVLRTRIQVKDGTPVQVIDAWAPRKLEVEDLTGRIREEREEGLRRKMRAEAATRFDLSRGPLLRVKVLRLEEELHVALFTMHHIVCDGWSMGVLATEVSVLYEAMSSGRKSPLPELEFQYADYAVWQRQSLQGELLERQLAYWRRQLGGNLPALELPTDRPQPEQGSHRGAHETLELSPELTRHVQELSRQAGVTIFVTLLAAFKVLLSRYSSQEDIIVGTAVSNRSPVQLESLIGFFVNTLPLRADLSGDPTFRGLLARVREVALGAYAHQDVPLERLVDELQPDRSLNQTPLFRACFLLQNTPMPPFHLPGLTLTPITIESETTKFDLTLSMSETSQSLIGTLEYNADLFNAVTIRKMAAHFQNLIESAVERPDQPLSSLRLLSEVESGDPDRLDMLDLQLSQKDFENILLEIGSA